MTLLLTLALTTINTFTAFPSMLKVLEVLETWLNANFTDNEVLPNGYNIIRKDRLVNQHDGGVLIALCDNISYNKLTAGKNGPNWSDRV